MKKLMKLCLVTGLIFTAFTASAQQPKKARTSVADTVKGTVKGGAAIEVAYSRPLVKGRTIGGAEIATYGKVWRTGANEATTITFSKDVKIEGKPLAAGQYALYSIPGEKDWVIIFNKGLKNWGTVYKQDEDVLRVTVKAGKAATFTEALKFMIEPAGKVGFAWGDTQVMFAVK
jgi:hypothetical protein